MNDPHPTRVDRIPKRHVALLIETSNEYARGLLRGVRSFIRENKPWSIYMGEYSRSATDLSWLTNWRGDGVIARIENQAVAEMVRGLRVPAVDLSASQYMPELPCLETDNRTIAEWAFRHLRERGFKHFAFCGDLQFVWSKQRREYFLRRVEQEGYPCSDYEIASEQHWMEERQAMVQFILELPKPVGVFVSYDNLGQKVLEACRLAGLFVPDEVGVISVDNDELMCNLSDPPLTSIVPDTFETGYQAAALLDRMMNGEHVPAGIRAIPPVDIALRLSTEAIAVDDKVVAEAIRLIRSSMYEDMTIDQLFRDIPYSRRVIESRFQRCLGRTPHDLMMEMKVKLIKQFLEDTALSLAMIADRLGFKHTEYMSVLFKRETGMTPIEYRRSLGR